MGKGSVVPSPEGDARRWFVVVMRALLTPERMDDLLSILSEDPPGEGNHLGCQQSQPNNPSFH